MKLAKEVGEENFANMYKKKFVELEIAQLCSDLVNGEEVKNVQPATPPQGNQLTEIGCRTKMSKEWLNCLK